MSLRIICPIRHKLVDGRPGGGVNRYLTNGSPTQEVEGITSLRPAWTAALAMSLALLASACSQGSVSNQPASPNSTSPSTPATPSATPTIDQTALPAVSAYMKFNTAAINAERHPLAHGKDWPELADIRKYSFDPIRAEYEAYIWGLEAQGVAYRGEPATPHITVTKVDLNASPWPTVTIEDCQTGGSWAEYVIDSGKRVPLAGNGKFPPPYLITAQIIRFKGHWGIQSTSADKSHTCTAQD